MSRAPERSPSDPNGPDLAPDIKDTRVNFRFVSLVVLLLSGLAVLSAYLVGKSARFQPDFLARVFLYGFTLLNLTMLLVLVFVLGRNLIKLFLERRQSVAGANFKTKLVVIFIGFALLPSALIMLVGSNLISTAVERWFSHPVEAVLVGAQDLVEHYYHEKQESARFYARRLSREIGEGELLSPARLSMLGRSMDSRLTLYQLDMITVLSSAQTLWTSARPGLPQYNPDSTLRLAERGVRGEETLHQDSLGDGTLIQYSSPIYRKGTRDLEGAVVVSYFVPRTIAATLEDVNQQANAYQQAEAQKEPIQDLYLSYFVMVSLLLVLASTWIGLYLAKRITGPVGELVEATERVMAGDLDHPVTGPAVDELSRLMDSFNRMTAKLKASQEGLESSRVDLETKNRELDRRRRYMETVLENIATGIVSFDRDGFVTRINQSAVALLDLDPGLTGRHYRDVFRDEALAPFRKILDAMRASGGRPALEEEIDLAIAGRELHVSVYLTEISGASTEPAGLLMVLDDLTQLLRAQKVAAWREVARRLAHEIKNPLTPIQLSAQRIRKHFRSRSTDLERVVEEGTGTIIEEVDSLKNLVDEFSQFARMPSVSAAAHDLNPLVNGTLDLYDGLFSGLTLKRLFAPDIPKVMVDPELIRRVFVNIIDNAIEANHGEGEVVVSTSCDRELRVARVEVADDGPGIAPADRDKLFMPYYSTKLRGSGLGLAIVQRLVAEHRGRIRVEENHPRGARFVVELPLEPKPESEPVSARSMSEAQEL